MAILSIFRFVAALLSLILFGAAGYLLWSWQAGELARDAIGAVYRRREDWRLWTGLGLLAWSFLGRFVVLALCARRDRLTTQAGRGAGRTIRSGSGSTLYVEMHGPDDGLPIIFTHGWGMDSTFWRQARQDLADRFRLILWDLPGLGRSKAADKAAISPEAFAADLVSLIDGAGLIDAAGGRKPVLVGHSIGGMIIQTLVRDQPALQNRIAGLVLLNTTYTNPLKTMAFSTMLQALRRPVLEPACRLVIALQPLVWAVKWQSYLSGASHLGLRLGFGKFVTRSQLEHTALLATRNPPAVLARGDLAAVRWDATGALARAWVPVLIVGGEKDIVTKLEASRTMQAESDMAALRVVEDAGHMGPMERADLYDTMIAEFALQVQPSASADVLRRPASVARDGADPSNTRQPRPPHLY